MINSNEESKNKKKKNFKKYLPLHKTQTQTHNKEKDTLQTKCVYYYNFMSDIFYDMNDIINNPVNYIINKIKYFKNKIIKKRLDYLSSAKEIIDKYGDEKVLNITLYRSVVPYIYTSFLNLCTQGEFKTRLKLDNKDNIFHISMIVKLSNNTLILCEKNKIIYLQLNPNKQKNKQREESYKLPMDNHNITFKELLENTRASIGDKKFFSYSIRNNNCGNWIEYILKVNGIYDKNINSFINQNTRKLFTGFPTLRKSVNKLINITATVNYIVESIIKIIIELIILIVYYLSYDNKYISF
jgi:hypothetical protein